MRILLMLLLLATLLPGSATAGVIFQTSQITFEAAATGLTTQDFAAARVANGSGVFVTGPLTNLTSNAVFNAGDIKSGLTITTAGSFTALGNQIYVAGIGVVGNTVKGIYTNGSDATMSLGFGTGFSAVGLNLIGFTNNTGARRFDITVFGSSSTYKQQTVSVVPDFGAGQFLGLIGTDGEKILGVSFQSGIGANEGVTSIQFGNLRSISAVPEPSGLVTVLTLLASGILLRPRRVREAMNIS